MDIKGTILRAKDGHPVPVLERDGLKRHLGSMYDGAVAASCWCEKVVSGMPHFLFGCTKIVICGGKYHFVWHGGLRDCVGTYRKGARADFSL